MALPALPYGFHFTVQTTEDLRVKVNIESSDGVSATDFAPVDKVTNEAGLVVVVEGLANSMAAAFLKYHSVQGWIDKNWPGA